jgi:hypothetical protein
VWRVSVGMDGGWKRTLLTFCGARLECDERPEPCEDRASSLVKVMVDACDGGYSVSSESRDGAELAGVDEPYGLCCMARDAVGGGEVLVVLMDRRPMDMAMSDTCRVRDAKRHQQRLPFRALLYEHTRVSHAARANQLRGCTRACNCAAAPGFAGER